MFENQNFVFGTVTGITFDNCLTVDLDNGEKGFVETQHATRRTFKGEPRLHWMVGRRRGFCAGEMRGDGLRELSARAYEEHEHSRIIEDFERKARNVYQGRLVSVTPDGKLAYYEIAQGVNASASIGDFNRMRLSSFHDIAIPSELPLVVKAVSPHGNIRVSAIPVFGDFRTNLEKLNLTPGCQVNGYVSSAAHSMGGAIVALAPNLTVHVPRARVGSWVQMQIDSVDADCQRVCGHVTGMCGDHPRYFDMTRWAAKLEELPAYIDMDEFYSAVCPKERPQQMEESDQPDGLDALLQQLDADVESPFALKTGETGKRLPLNYCNGRQIALDALNGCLTERHMAVAKAINALKYTTLEQVREYLRLVDGMEVQMDELRRLTGKLLSRDIVHKLNIMDGERVSLGGVLYPGATNYFKYTGMARYLPSWQYSVEPDVALIKCHLSANQLLLGMLREKGDLVDCEMRVYIRTDEDLRIRPRFRLKQADGKALYLESARSNWKDGMLEKLQRYAQYFDGTQEKAEVCITLEGSEDVEPFAREVEALRLKYDVSITSDGSYLPCPEMKRVPAYAPQQKGFFFRFRNWLNR